MRYRLLSGRPLETEFRRLWLSLHDNLALSLLMACRDSDRGVHQARRRCKEIRALMRLLGGDPGGQRFYRSLAAGLSGQRDAVVMQASWQELREEVVVLQGAEFSPVEQFLHGLGDMAVGQPSDRNTFLELALDVEARRQQPPGCDFPGNQEAVERRVVRVYRRARKALKMAQETQSRDNFHRFRKRSKDLYYSLRFLRPLLPGSARQVVKRLKVLTEIQGLANDVSVLDDFLQTHADDIRLNQVAWHQLRQVLLNKERALQTEVYRQAKPLLSSRPRQFIKSL